MSSTHVLKFKYFYFISQGTNRTPWYLVKLPSSSLCRELQHSRKTRVSMEFSNFSRHLPLAHLNQKHGRRTDRNPIFRPRQLFQTQRVRCRFEKSDDDDNEEISAAQVFHDTIKEKAEIGQVTGDLILSFEEVLVLTPRGRYDMDMFPDFLRLRGKTYDYKVLYQSIARLFLFLRMTSKFYSSYVFAFSKHLININ